MKDLRNKILVLARNGLKYGDTKTIALELGTTPATVRKYVCELRKSGELGPMITKSPKN